MFAIFGALCALTSVFSPVWSASPFCFALAALSVWSSASAYFLRWLAKHESFEEQRRNTAAVLTTALISILVFSVILSLVVG